jgi:4-alpha-glucanotransferase
LRSFTKTAFSGVASSKETTRSPGIAFGIRRSFERFCAENDDWLRDYSLFAALRSAHRGADWTRWDPEIRSREPNALRQAEKHLYEEVRYHRFTQYSFFRQWADLKSVCEKNGIGLIGDIPIYVAQDSADVWANQDIFDLDPDGRPRFVAGVPPDYFSKTGQLWGNPLYRWEVLQRRGYDWWLSRLRRMFERFEAVRLDHFIGFQRYYRVPQGARTAEQGEWMDGPGADFFERVRDALANVEIIVEDLGVVTTDVKALRDKFNFPGIRVLLFAFGTGAFAEDYLPHNYPRNCVVYTGTHDNDTVVGWFEDKGGRGSARTRREAEREREFALRYLGSDGRKVNWAMVRAALSSVANTAIIPAQDLLGLGRDSRMNRPGTVRRNWEWRLMERALDEGVVERLRTLTETYGRMCKP